MMDKMIDLAARRGIADRFHFPGFQKGKEVYQMLKASDVYMMPSVSEPFGISPLEAMQMGVPVNHIEAIGLRGDTPQRNQDRLLGRRRHGRCRVFDMQLSGDV